MNDDSAVDTDLDVIASIPMRWVPGLLAACGDGWGNYDYGRIFLVPEDDERVAVVATNGALARRIPE